MIKINTQIENIRQTSLLFFNRLKEDTGYKYTINHDSKKYPAAMLYGTWSYVYAKHLILGNTWDDADEKQWLKNAILRYRQNDGTIYPKVLASQKNSKSHEYLKHHTSNYSFGALMILDGKYDFQSKAFDVFLDQDYLHRWLSQRSFIRPWEESNNIVNVASYLALCNDHGQSKGKERLYQMLEWHNKYQNPRSGGFDNLGVGRKHIIQSLAGSVHNFHIHHYLNEPMRYEEEIGEHLIALLFQGPLTACFSIDFVELACYVLPFLSDGAKSELKMALYYHLESLIKYQNSDGGWYENEKQNKPTVAAGMKEERASSCSYGTWFRLCSIAMISITLLNGNKNDWSFRKTLGMGYHPDKWFTEKTNDLNIDKSVKLKYKRINLPHVFYDRSIELISKIIR